MGMTHSVHIRTIRGAFPPWCNGYSDGVSKNGYPDMDPTGSGIGYDPAFTDLDVVGQSDAVDAAVTRADLTWE